MGWNKELIVLYQKHILDYTPLMIKLTGFNYQLKNAIVQRRDQEGADYFINAGATQQNGIEIEMNVDRRLKGLIQNLFVKTTYAFSHFKYRQFEKLGIDYEDKITFGDSIIVSDEQLKQDGLNLIAVNCIDKYTLLTKYYGYTSDKANEVLQLLAEQEQKELDKELTLLNETPLSEDDDISDVQ